MPLSTLSASALEQNFKALGDLHADLLDQLRDAEPPDDLELHESEQGVPSGTYGGRQLCSRRRPLDEADRLIEKVDCLEHAAVVVFGFGLGYHVQRLAEKLGKTGLVVVYEPDVNLLRGAFEQIDHSRWLRTSQVVFLTDAEDRGSLAARLRNADALLGQGVTFLEHPASRARLGTLPGTFSRVFTEHVRAARTTLATTLMRSVDTVRNLLLNIDHYVGCDGVADLKDAAAGYPAVVVSAGPSLKKNMHLLAQPGMRDRCVIIAVQTTLKPLLAAGIKPHFVTALDFHQLSKRFYEGLESHDLKDVTLVAEPKVHHFVPDSFPGRLRCCASDFLDKLLKYESSEHGVLPAGATVAHLAVYLARHLGCDPIMLIGQDLGFPDGLYYAPGTAIHDVWAPELNPFNTIEMMEWQRIARFHRHLNQAVDVNGRSIYSDEQMTTYLRQFERDFMQFKREGVTIIDATEGGVAKQHTQIMPLAEALDQYATRELPSLPLATDRKDPARLREASQRVSDVRREVEELRNISRQTKQLIQKMLRDQQNKARMDRYFRRIDRYRRDVEARMGSFELLNQINQAGVFRRLRADRRLQLTKDLEPVERQRYELERDLDNVSWLIEAAEEMIRLFNDAERILAGDEARQSEDRRQHMMEAAGLAGSKRLRKNMNVTALVPVDPDRNGLGMPRSLGEPFNGRPVIQQTLERIGQSQRLKEIVLIVPNDCDVEPLLDRSRIKLPVEVERCDGSPFGAEQRAIAAARWWAETCWRGGIAGVSVYDEVLCPRIMHEVMKRRGITAAVLVAPDWPLVDPSSDSGLDALVDRHLEEPERRTIVFTQSPPGLNGCLVSASLMEELSERNRLSTIGGLLVFQPHAPQMDPIAGAPNVQVDHRLRHSLVRATYDQPRYRQVLEQALQAWNGSPPMRAIDALDAIEEAYDGARFDRPQHLILELTTARAHAGRFAQWPLPRDVPGRSLSLDVAKRIIDQFADQPDAVLTLGGFGDPIRYEHFDDVIRHAKESGIRGVHVRTELDVENDVLDRLLAAGADVISVDVHADRRETYTRMMGRDALVRVIDNIGYLVDQRTRLTDHTSATAFAVPWIVPRLQRCVETHEDLQSFFARWQHVLGTAVLEGVPPFECVTGEPVDALVKPPVPQRVVKRELLRRMLVLADGSVPVSELDCLGDDCAGNMNGQSMIEAWAALIDERNQRWRDDENSDRAPRMCFP